jgi:hypothetical protein
MTFTTRTGSYGDQCPPWTSSRNHRSRDGAKRRNARDRGDAEAEDDARARDATTHLARRFAPWRAPARPPSRPGAILACRTTASRASTRVPRAARRSSPFPPDFHRGRSHILPLPTKRNLFRGRIDRRAGTTGGARRLDARGAMKPAPRDATTSAVKVFLRARPCIDDEGSFVCVPRPTRSIDPRSSPSVVPPLKRTRRSPSSRLRPDPTADLDLSPPRVLHPQRASG